MPVPAMRTSHELPSRASMVVTSVRVRFSTARQARLCW